MTPQERNARQVAAIEAARNASTEAAKIAAIRRAMGTSDTNTALRTELLGGKRIGTTYSKEEVPEGVRPGDLVPIGYPHWGWIVRVERVTANALYGDSLPTAKVQHIVDATIVAFLGE
jgi:hypothetical protein